LFGNYYQTCNKILTQDVAKYNRGEENIQCNYSVTVNVPFSTNIASLRDANHVADTVFYQHAVPNGTESCCDTVFYQHAVPSGTESCCDTVFYQHVVPNGTEFFYRSLRLLTPPKKGEIISKKVRQDMTTE
jgi:hypothetical protein